MESRKRPLSEVDDSVVNKKRILIGVNGAPHVNGSDEDEGFREKLEVIFSLKSLFIDMSSKYLIRRRIGRKLFIVG